MSSNTTKALINNITLYQYNPAAIQRIALQALKDASSGDLDIVDPTSPFVFCLEMQAVQMAAFMQKDEALTRRQYPYSAQTAEDLYVHMTDRDYINRFATPSSAKFSLMFDLAEVLSKMVLDQSTGIKKLVIPRNTFFTVADTTFSIQYPIEIRQLAHGGLNVVYDVEKPSPLQDLASNLIAHEIRKNSDTDYLFFEVDAFQFSIVSQTAALSQAIDFKISIALQDNFYFARVYAEITSGVWQEIKTTHTDQIYDPAVPTAVLKVVDKIVQVTIPQIYTNSQLLNRNVRIDLYQTKGPLSMLLYEYPISAYVVTFQAYDKTDNTIFTAPLKTLKVILPFSDKVVSGGSEPLSFSELRDRVIKNAIGPQSLPITPAKIEKELSINGYQIVRNIDNITDRVFLATRPMPTPPNVKLITAAAASIESVIFKLDEVVQQAGAIDNGSSVTITPDTVYKNVNGVITIVTNEELQILQNLAPERKALAVTVGDYMYTPFHYVLDTSNNEFEARVYYLDDPVIETKLFVAENDSTLIQVETASYAITRSPTGYKLHVTTLSGQAYKDLNDAQAFAQLAYIPYGERDLAYLNGTLIGTTDDGERVFEFDLSTNFNVDKKDNLTLTKFALYTNEERTTLAGLLVEFDLLYSTSAVLGSQYQSNVVDETLGKALLPSTVSGLAYERLRVRFGYALKTLWARARTIVSSAIYDTWTTDVPRMYEKNVYQRNSDGYAITIDANNRPQFQILHAAGDPVLDESNNPVYLHRAGDVKYDLVTGLPVIKNNRGVQRQVDLLLIEGAYRFANDAISTQYSTVLTQTVVEWLTNDLASITLQLLDQTRLYFYPKTTVGSIDVLVGEGVVRSINAAQAFIANLYVPASVYNNAELRALLTKTTVLGISEVLKNQSVSIDLLTSYLRDRYGDDVISVQISGLGGDLALQALTVIDPAKRCGIRKRLEIQADNSLIVQEDVTCNFILHQSS